MSTETTNKKTTLILLVLLGAALLAYLVSISVTNAKLADLDKSMRTQIAEQETLLVAIAETTARNGADKVTESIVRDCSITERDSFDNLLGRLNEGLARAELVELERLFGRCGSFFAERKSVMVARLAREIEVFESSVEQLAIIAGEDVREDYQVDVWNSLATEELKQSELFSSLVQKQDQIISTLLDGKSASSPEITEILQEVRELQETLIVVNQQASSIRSELVSL